MYVRVASLRNVTSEEFSYCLRVYFNITLKLGKKYLEITELSHVENDATKRENSYFFSKITLIEYVQLRWTCSRKGIAELTLTEVL
jgi:hypothetical protein